MTQTIDNSLPASLEDVFAAYEQIVAKSPMQKVLVNKILYGTTEDPHSWLEEGDSPMSTQQLADGTVVPYHNQSKGAKALTAALGRAYIKREHFQAHVVAELTTLGSKAKSIPRPVKVFNWGCTQLPGGLTKYFDNITVFNTPEAVQKCTNKIKFFDAVKGKVRIPAYTTNIAEAMNWVAAGIETLGRRATGTKGRDICWYEQNTRFLESDFWVQYIDKDDEYRIHVAFGKVIDMRLKTPRLKDADGNKIDISQLNYKIRNLDNGFIFKKNDISVPTDVIDQALAAVAAVGLDYGAVDVIYTKEDGRAYVLEVNTAPALVGSTVNAYADALKAAL